MLTRRELLANREDLSNRVYGALIGLAIGDSLGDAARKQENRESYGITTDFNSGASWSTDDTEFALLTAQTLIACGGRLTSDLVVAAWREHVIAQDELRRGGASEVGAAANLRRGIQPPLSGQFNTYHQSDGAAMRIAPIGVFCAGDPDRAKRLAEEDACVSHFREGIWGAQAVAAAVAVAMADGTMAEIFSAALSAMPKDSWIYAAMNTAFGIVDRANGSILDAWMPLHDALRTTSWATSAEAIPSALACLRLAGDDFRRGVVLAANFARDADTIGAVAGAILGAKYGASAIPERWREKTRYPSGTCLRFTKGMDILALSEQLTDLILTEDRND